MCTMKKTIGRVNGNSGVNVIIKKVGTSFNKLTQEMAYADDVVKCFWCLRWKEKDGFKDHWGKDKDPYFEKEEANTPAEHNMIGKYRFDSVKSF